MIMTIMDCEGLIGLQKPGVSKIFEFCLSSCSMSAPVSSPLSVNEVIACLQERWQVTYDLRLVTRDKRLYLQLMWAYLEQQSFPLNEEDFRKHLNEVLEVINRLGQAEIVRKWLRTVVRRPRIGRPLTLWLKVDESLKEFVI